MHAARLIPEIRTLTPDADGWARHEKTGRACAVCPCGLNTGFVDSGQASDAYRAHTAPGQKVQVTLAGGSKTMTSLIRDMVRNG